VYRPAASGGTWYVQRSLEGYTMLAWYDWGKATDWVQATDIPLGGQR
jgi:hypothetical protein